MKTFYIQRNADAGGSGGGGDAAASTTPVAPSAPAVTPESVSNDDAPNWVREAGLTDVHNKTKPTESATPVVKPTGTVAAAPASPVAPAAPIVPQFNAKEFGDAVARGIKDANTKPVAGPSHEEIAKQLGIVTVTPEVFKSVLGVDGTPEQVKGMNDLLQAVAKQAVNIVQVLNKQQFDQMQSQMSPYISVMREQEAVRQRDMFFTEHKDLVGYEPLVMQTFQRLKAEGHKFPDIPSARAAVNAETRRILKDMGITPVAPKTTTATNTRTTAPARTMTPTLSGGRNGGQGTSAPSDKMTSIWGQK